jgi:hypothetical protein
MNHHQFMAYFAFLNDRGFFCLGQDTDRTRWVELTQTGQVANGLVSAAISCLGAGGVPSPEDGIHLAFRGKFAQP